MMRAAQLPLPLRLEDHARFETFVSRGAATAAEHVAAVARGDRAQWLLWLAGPPGSGKSHLLQAACHEAGRVGRRAIHVPLASNACASADVLEGLGALDLVAIDDLERVAGDAHWEAQLFSLFEAIAAARGCLLLAAAGRPREIGFALPDLASRAASSVVYRLEPLGDEDLQFALVELARRRGLEIDAAAARFLLERIARDMRNVRLWLERLDEASLAAKRRITIPFIGEVLAEHTPARS